MVVTLNAESGLKKYYQWFNYVFYNDNNVFVIGYPLLHKNINATMMNINQKPFLYDIHYCAKVLIQ